MLSLLWLPLFQCQRFSGTVSHLTRKLFTELFLFYLQEVMYLPSHLLVPQWLPRLPHLPQQQRLPQLCLKFPLKSWSYQALNFPSHGTVETCRWMKRIPTLLKNLFTRELCKREHTLVLQPCQSSLHTLLLHVKWIRRPGGWLVRKPRLVWNFLEQLRLLLNC